jgi:hypothetical protein
MAIAQEAPVKTPFSADMKFTSKRGQDTSGKVYMGHEHMRIDVSDAGPYGGVFVISNFSARTSDVVMPSQHMYMEMSADQAKMGRSHNMVPDIKSLDPNNPCSHQEGYTCKDMGGETVDGRSTEHWRVTDKEGKVTDAWIDKTLKFPIKSVSDDQTWTLSNIKEGEPSTSLFEIPAGFQKMDMGQMMQGAHRQQQ